MKAFALLLPLAACGGAEPEAQAPTGARIACAVGEAGRLAPDCTAQRTTRDGRTRLTISDPDGGFRRLEAGADGAGIDAADGAARARTARELSGEIAVEVDGDRYRLPAER